MKISLILPILLLTGCTLFENKEGIKCDNENVISLTEKILNKNMFSKIVNKNITPIKVDKNSIVEWDYKNGRYLCKVKVTADIKKKDYILNLLSPYGIYVNENKLEGWIYYQTYMTIKEFKKFKENKDSSFYVEIEKKSNIPVW